MSLFLPYLPGMQQVSSRKTEYRWSGVRYGTHVTCGNNGLLEFSRVNVSRRMLAWSRCGYETIQRSDSFMVLCDNTAEWRNSCRNVTIQRSDRLHIVMWQYSDVKEFMSLSNNTAEWQNSCRNVTIPRNDRIHVVMWQYSGVTDFMSLCDNTTMWKNSCR